MEKTRCRILFVEDDQLDQTAFKRFVEQNDLPYECRIAGSVLEAQRILGSGQFDIIISDHSLGDGTSIDILDSAKNTPVVVVTGAGDEETAIKAWKAGAYDYLIKDLDRNYLKAIPITVENAVRHDMVEKKLQLLSGAVMSTDDSVYITDMEGTIIFVNKAFCETYGYKEEEIVGTTGSMLWIGKRQSENTRSVFQTQTVGSAWEVGFYHKRKDDSVFPVSLSRSIIKGPNGNDIAIVAVARDISERILIEDEFRTSNLKLQKKSQLQNEVAVTVTETVQRLLADGDIDRAKRVICDYLDISRIDGGKMELKLRQFSFTALVSQVAETLLPVAAEKNIELKSSVPDCELAVSADYDRMALVLTNLLSRAIEFCSADGHISLRVKDTGDELSVEIQDDGPVLKRDEMHRMVNRSDWIKEQFDAGRENLALGLRIAKELVEMHGGRVWTERADAKAGNIFCFTVPKTSARQKVSTAVTSASAK